MPPFVLGAVRNSNDPRASVLIWHAEKPRAEIGAGAHGGARRKVLRRDGEGEPDDAEPDEEQTHAHDISLVAFRDAVIDDRRHDERHDELERGFQQLEKRRKDRLDAIRFDTG